MHCTVQYSTLHFTAPHCTALHTTALHCTALHCSALHLELVVESGPLATHANWFQAVGPAINSLSLQLSPPDRPLATLYIGFTLFFVFGSTKFTTLLTHIIISLK